MRVVFTGPPCSGKTTVFKRFRELLPGSQFYPEVARKLITHFREYQPGKLPSRDLAMFQDHVFEEQLGDYNSFAGDEQQVAFYDRGMVDGIAYRGGIDSTPPEIVHDCRLYRYDKVFYFPYWDDIYCTDEQRLEDRAGAKQLDKLLRAAYKGTGYKITEVPLGSAEERVSFVLMALNI